MKKSPVVTIVAIGIGAALFFVLGRFVSVPSPVPNTTINLQYGLLAFMAILFGPLAGAVLVPLILSSMDRIEIISNAMELRGFGKNKKRSWYMARPFACWDVVAMAVCLLLLACSLLLNFLNGGRFYNPFI